MPSLPPQIIESYLNEYGWQYRSIKKDLWETGFQGRDRIFPLQLKLTPTWLSLAVSPLTRREISPEVAPELALFLLEISEQIHMVKIHLNERGELSLTLDLFTQGLEFESFCDALGVLAYYSDFLYERVVVKLDQLRSGHERPRQIYLT